MRCSYYKYEILQRQKQIKDNKLARMILKDYTDLYDLNRHWAENKSCKI